MMFGSWEKCAKAINPTYVAVSNEEISGITSQDQQLSHNSYRCQSKIDAQATKIATVRLELNKTLEENWKLKDMFNLDWLVEAVTKVVSTMTMKESPKSNTGHSIYKCFQLCWKAETALVGTWCQWDAGAQYDLPLL